MRCIPITNARNRCTDPGMVSHRVTEGESPIRYPLVTSAWKRCTDVGTQSRMRCTLLGRHRLSAHRLAARGASLIGHVRPARSQVEREVHIHHDRYRKAVQRSGLKRPLSNRIDGCRIQAVGLIVPRRVSRT